MHYWNDYGDHHARWMTWAIGLPLAILFWGCVLWGVISLLRLVGRNGASPSRSGLVPRTSQGPNPAKTILDERFACGEIDEDEYRRRSDALHF